MTIPTATNPSIRLTARPIPKYSGPKPPYDFLDVDKKYSWLKTPRYQGMPMEVGPLARMVVGYASGQKEIKAAVDGVLKHFDAPPSVLFSTLGRIAARAIESQLMASHLEQWVDELDANMTHGKVAICNTTKWDPSYLAKIQPRIRMARSAARLARPLGGD